MVPGASGDRLCDGAPNAMGAEDEPLQVWIEIDPGTEPVAGRVAVAGAVARAFVGWLELVDAIDHARHPSNDED
jgi:hypothetical protein